MGRVEGKVAIVTGGAQGAFAGSAESGRNRLDFGQRDFVIIAVEIVAENLLCS